jgi:sulfur-carrier protein
MAIKVRIPEVLRKLTNNSELVAVEAGTVREMLEALEKQHPGIKERICDEQGNVRRFVNVFVNEEDIRFQENLDTKLSTGTEVSILPAIAGGMAKASKDEGEYVRRVYLTFNKELVTQPVIYHLVKKFDVVPNIRSASVTDDMGIMGVEFSGKKDSVEKALEWAKKQGLKVDPIEMNVVEP